MQKLLGRGGFGEAYLADDTRLQRDCVIKFMVLPKELDNVTRRHQEEAFLHEAQMLVALNRPGHPNIPEIYDLLTEEKGLVMKHIAGRSLEDLIARRLEPFPVAQAIRYAYSICSALVYMHSHQPDPVLHRDIKPANILLDAEDRIWLIDFGLARGNPTGIVRDMLIAGTPGYAPPEQWDGHSQPASDVFALGATLFTMLSGQRARARCG